MSAQKGIPELSTADKGGTQSQFGFIPWVLRGRQLIPLLQIVGVIVTLRLLRRWRWDPALRPSRGRLWRLHILLPLIPNLGSVAIPVFLLVSGMLRFTLLLLPDFSWIALICGGFAGIWTFLRTELVLRNFRKPSSPQTFVGQPSIEQ